MVDLTRPLHSGIPYWPGDGYGPFRYAPIHFVAEGTSVDQLNANQLLKPAVVFDISERAAANASALLDTPDIVAWEQRHGQVPRDSVALVRSGWSSRWADPAAFRNDADGVMRFPAV